MNRQERDAQSGCGRWRAAVVLMLLLLPSLIVAQETATTEPAAAPVAAEPAAVPAPAPAPAAEAPAQALEKSVADLKREIVKLNRDLFILEEELLFPSNTQMAVFLSMDVGVYFQLDSVQLKMDDKLVTSYLYTRREVDALVRGGVQRLFLGNLRTGAHELVASFVGYGPNGREYRRSAALKFEKGTATKFLELKIVDDSGKQQPEFTVKEWQ